MLCSTSVCGSSKHRHSLFTPGQPYRARVRSVRSKQSNTTVTAALGFFRKKIATAGAIDDLLAAIEGTGRGCTTSSSQRAKIDAAINVLEGAADRGNDFGTDLTATWKLLWTTEKVIDSQNLTLQNVITFPPSGSFVVQSSIDLAQDQRVSFQFKAANLNLPQRSLKLPPYGKGWFDTVFVNSKIRISKDSRGDTLVVARDGPPRDVSQQLSAL